MARTGRAPASGLQRFYGERNMNPISRDFPNCGRQVPPDAPAELCPSCLVRGGLSQSGSWFESKSDSGSTLHLVIPEDASLPEGAPARLGSYELLEKIAQGGMGVVYKARHTGLDRIVALKMIRSGVLATPKDVERFQREARSAAKLHHPNIVTIHDIGEQDGQHYYTMDFVLGENLSERARTKPFSPRQAAEITAGVAAAIHYAHQSGVLHRDIKAANVILAPEQQPRVLDFGLALILADDSTLTQTGTPVGSPPYMPPEQAAGQAGRIDARSDVYGLGALLYELLSGHPPFRAASTMETLRLVLENEVVPPRRLNPALPSDLETICLKCLEKDPDRRYQTAQELGEELRRFIRDEPILARPPSAAYLLQKAWQRNKVVYTAGAAVATALAVGMGVSLWQATRATAARNDSERNERAAIANASAAQRERDKAQAATYQAQLNRYVSDVGVAYRLLREGSLTRAEELLRQHKPAGPTQPEFRGFEWHCLWRLCHGDDALATSPPRRFPVESVSASSDGRWIATTSSRGVAGFSPWLRTSDSQPRGELTIFAAQSLQPVATHATNLSAPTAVAFFPSEQALLAGHADGSIFRWSGDLFGKGGKLAGSHSNSVRTIAFSPAG